MKFFIWSVVQYHIFLYQSEAGGILELLYACVSFPVGFGMEMLVSVVDVGINRVWAGVGWMWDEICPSQHVFFSFLPCFTTIFSFVIFFFLLEVSIGLCLLCHLAFPFFNFYG